MKGFRFSNLISINISNLLRHHQSLHRTNHHTNSQSILRSFSSSSYNNNNRSNDGYSGGRPPPRRRSDDRVSGEYRTRKPNYHSNDSKYRSSNRSSVEVNRVNDRDSRKSASNSSYVPFADDDDDEHNYQNAPVNPNYSSGSKHRVSNRADNRKYGGNSSYVPFSDGDEQNYQNTPANPSRQVNSNKVDSKVQDVDGFLDRFKLGLDEEKIKPNIDNFNGGRVSEEGEVPADERLLPPEDADEIFRKMKETGLIPNAVAMLHGLCQDGLVQDAMKLFGVMRERGSIPEVVIYTAVVEGFCKAQKFDEAIRIFRKMQSNGIVPNAFSYGVLVQGLVKGKQLDDGLDFCLEMVEAGHSPNLATFTGLVNVFCRERGLESAQIVIGKLKDKGFGFDEKGVRDFMEKKGPFSPMVWEAIFGKKNSQLL